MCPSVVVWYRSPGLLVHGSLRGLVVSQVRRASCRKTFGDAWQGVHQHQGHCLMDLLVPRIPSPASHTVCSEGSPGHHPHGCLS